MTESNITLKKLLTARNTIVQQSCSSKQELLALISGVAASDLMKEGVSPENILSAMSTREQLGSTGFGKGIAIPHCRLEGIDRFVVGLITIQDPGVDFDSLDGKPVRLALFIIAPTSANDIHVRLLSAISQALMIPGAVDEVCAAGTPNEACNTMLAHVRDDLSSNEQTQKQLFHVFVQDEEISRSLLEVFTALDAHAVTVMDGRQAHSYLAKAPLFAGLWGDQANDFCQVIMVTLNKKLSNEAIRRIEQTTGPLAKCRKVLVTVQDVAYSAGSLSL